MRLRYCLRYLTDVAAGLHGKLTWRMIWGDTVEIWRGCSEIPNAGSARAARPRS